MNQLVLELRHGVAIARIFILLIYLLLLVVVHFTTTTLEQIQELLRLTVAMAVTMLIQVSV